ncbi:MAG: hypothetical protein Q8S13_01465, partial [Dehalococcoidia bacterium]|nr:hypothetical protein [Dehalococcoidia bacterium]
ALSSSLTAAVAPSRAATIGDSPLHSHRSGSSGHTSQRSPVGFSVPPPPHTIHQGVMAVQLLRQLAEMPVCEPRLRDTARRAMRRINRDVIDAEAQLRLG